MENDDPKKMIVGLPPVKPSTDSMQETNLQNNFERARNCPKCGKPGRIVSNNCGVNVHCGPCKIHWPISNSPLRPETPGAAPRGLHKETSMEPDWNLAFDKDVGDT